MSSHCGLLFVFLGSYNKTFISFLAKLLGCYGKGLCTSMTLRFCFITMCQYVWTKITNVNRKPYDVRTLVDSNISTLVTLQSP